MGKTEHIHALASQEPVAPGEQEEEIQVLNGEEMGEGSPAVKKHQATKGKQEESGLCSDVTFSAGPPLGPPFKTAAPH